MTYWTALWITILSGPMEGSDMLLLYPSLLVCEEATSVVSQTLPYDHNMVCEESTTIATSIRPKNRGNN